MSDEIFDIVDESGRRIGQAPRSVCHGDPRLIHQSVHVLVENGAGQLFLQKRSSAKDTQPGKWDTSVGGHLRPGETPVDAARREMREELGAAPADLVFAYEYLWRCPVETELVRTFVAHNNGPFALQPDELDDGRFWDLAEIDAQLGEGLFTPHFEEEYRRWQAWRSTLG